MKEKHGHSCWNNSELSSLENVQSAQRVTLCLLSVAFSSSVDTFCRISSVQYVFICLPQPLEMKRGLPPGC